MAEQAMALCNYKMDNESIPAVGRLLADDDTVEFGNHKFTMLHTPGHTPGSVFFYCKEEKVAFSGDTLFQMSIGRTDLWQGSYADITLSDDMYGESTYEKAECKMLSNAVRLAVEKAALTDADIDVLLSGDLLNQIISASFAARDFQFPFLGLYSACSTMSEGMLLAAALVDGGFAKNCVAATGSHFASAERQYRYPLELGCTRPPQAQWTVTGAGGCVVSGYLAGRLRYNNNGRPRCAWQQNFKGPYVGKRLHDF